MKLWLICATEYEAKIVVDYYKLKEIDWLKNVKVYSNDYIVLIVSGIWKVMATIWISYLVQTFECKHIINIWVVWSCKKKWNIGDILLIDQIIQYDVEIPFRNKYTNVIYAPLKLIALENGDEKYIICATGDKVIDTNKKEKLWNMLDIDIVDMELFAIWKYMEEVGKLDKLIAIKWVSDDLQWNYKLDNLKNTMKKICMKLDEIYTIIE